MTSPEAIPYIPKYRFLAKRENLPQTRAMSRSRPANFANTLAWALVIVLAAAAIALVLLIGPLGLILLGLLTLFVCSQFSLHEASPTWGKDVFQARMTPPGSRGQRAGEAFERAAAQSPLRFYSRCGLVLIVAGVAALAYQYWRG